MTTLGKILLILGIVGLVVGLGLYFIKAETVEGVEVKSNPITAEKATYYTKSGAWLFTNTHYYAEVQVKPTETAKSNVDYLLVQDNGIVKVKYEVSWNQLELAINKSKVITNEISQDEYTAIGMQTHFTTNTFEAKLQHQLLYLVPGIIILILFIISFILFNTLVYIKLPGGYAYDGDTIFKETSLGASPTTQEYIMKALNTMDRTHKWYNNEEEANRELVSVLSSQGLEASYQFNLGDGTTADAKVGDEVLIEGKLEPDTNEVNRLIGQLQGYSSHPYNYKIHVVIYGRWKPDALMRISHEIASRYSNKVFLHYLPNPKRVRRQGDLHD